MTGTSMILEIEGSPALSRFRLEKLTAALQERDGRVRGITARYLHFVQVRSPLQASGRAVLQRLLTYGPRLDEQPAGGRLVLVTPRPGTISPWSSKATDIAQVCGLDAVRRIERGIGYLLELDADADAVAFAGLQALLYDRMTEAAVSDFAAAAVLFEAHTPRPLGTLPLRTRGRAALEQDSRIGVYSKCYPRSAFRAFRSVR